MYVLILCLGILARYAYGTTTMSSKLIVRWLVVIIVLLVIPQDSESQSDTKAPAKQSGRLYLSIYLDASIPITERIGTVFIIKKEETIKLAVSLLNCESELTDWSAEFQLAQPIIQKSAWLAILPTNFILQHENV